jgi:ABC-type Na+ efflux pump permease subunit
VSAKAIAWVALLSIVAVVVVGAFLAISSTLSFFNEEASKVASQLDNAPQLRSVVEQTLRFCSSFVWTIFALLLVALGISLLVLRVEDLASR